MSNMPRYYRLFDGRIWCVASAVWVDAGDATYQSWLSAGGVHGTAPDESGDCSEQGLRDALTFYGAPMGGLQSLDNVVAAFMSAIQAEKCRVRDAGFEVDGVHFDSDQAARLAYMEFALALAQDAAYVQAAWKASSGVWVSMDAALFGKVKAAGEVAIAAAFAWQQKRDAEVAAIKAAVDAGTMTEADARSALAAVSTTYAAS